MRKNTNICAFGGDPEHSDQDGYLGCRYPHSSGPAFPNQRAWSFQQARSLERRSIFAELNNEVRSKVHTDILLVCYSVTDFHPVAKRKCLQSVYLNDGARRSAYRTGRSGNRTHNLVGGSGKAAVSDFDSWERKNGAGEQAVFL